MIPTSILSQLKTLARTVRGLSIDAVQQANSGHPGLPLGCADIGALLYGRELKHFPGDPAWPDRDRFVLSAGHGSMLLYSLLHLTGYDLPLDEIKRFRQLGSRTPGHPEFGLLAGVETTTGPLGAGLANAVGMAIAETMLAGRFNTTDHEVIDHYTYVLAGDGCMMEGVASEAASLAGHLALGKLIVIYDSNRITIEGETDLAFTESVAGRFAAYGWQVLHADGYDLNELAVRLAEARAETDKPSIIVATTTIGFGSPNKAGTHEVHGAPLGADEVKATKSALGLDPDAFFDVPATARSFVRDLNKDLRTRYENWKRTFDSWSTANPEKKALWDLCFSLPGAGGAAEALRLRNPGKLPAIAWPQTEAGVKMATRSASGASLQAAAAALPNLVGGSADLAPSNNTELKGLGHYQADSRNGRTLHFGVREHAMGSVVNGMVLHGGLKPFAATFLVFADYMRPSIRLAAIMKIPSIFVFTHDSIWVGEDGPTHQPTEQLASLRAISGLEVLRPADAQETTVAWEMALSKGFGSHSPANSHDHAPAQFPANGPAVLALTRQNLTVFEKPAGWKKDMTENGAYIAREASGGPAALASGGIVIFATGSELGIALPAAAAIEASDTAVRVVSVPSIDRLRTVWQSIRPRLIPEGARTFAAEAGNRMSWAGIVGHENVLGIDSFGECGPGEKVAAYFGFTVEGLVAFISERLGTRA